MFVGPLFLFCGQNVSGTSDDLRMTGSDCCAFCAIFFSNLAFLWGGTRGGMRVFFWPRFASLLEHGAIVGGLSVEPGPDGYFIVRMMLDTTSFDFGREKGEG